MPDMEPSHFAREHLPTLTRLAEALRDLAPDLRHAGPELGPARWVVLARIEDYRSDFPADDRITSATLDDFVRTFDPQIRRVPVISGQGTGASGHASGELVPTGEVVAIERDRINLWGKVRSILDPRTGLPRIDVGVSDGLVNKSIMFRRRSNEADGAVVYHLAQLSLGEPPGIANMPTLDQEGFGLTDDQLAQLRSMHTGDSSAGTALRLFARDLNREWRRYGGAQQHLTSDLEFRSTAWSTTLAAEGGEDLLQEAHDMDPELLATALRSAIEPLADSITANNQAIVDLGQRMQNAPATLEVTEPVRTAPAQPPPDTREAPPDRDPLLADAMQLVAHIGRSGLLSPQTAQRQALHMLGAGEDAYRAWRAMVMEQLRGSLASSLGAEMTPAAQPSTTAMPATQAREFHSFTGFRVSRPKLELLRIALSEQMAQPTGQRDLRALSARCTDLAQHGGAR